MSRFKITDINSCIDDTCHLVRSVLEQNRQVAIGAPHSAKIVFYLQTGQVLEVIDRKQIISSLNSHGGGVSGLTLLFLSYKEDPNCTDEMINLAKNSLITGLNRIAGNVTLVKYQGTAAEQLPVGESPFNWQFDSGINRPGFEDIYIGGVAEVMQDKHNNRTYAFHITKFYC